MDNSFKIDGEILCIDQTRPSKEGSSMLLRDFWIEQVTAGESNYIKCQLKGNNCPKLDGFLPKDEVVISFSLAGPFGGAKQKEGHPCSALNPQGLTGFSPNINVFKIEFSPGFKRAEKTLTPKEISAMKDPRFNTMNSATGKPWTVDEIINDLPF